MYLCPDSCSFRIWLHKLVLSLTVLSCVYSTSKREHKPLPHPLTQVCLRCASNPSRIHTPETLLSDRDCLCASASVTMHESCWGLGGINNFSLISVWENQTLSRTLEYVFKKKKNYIMCEAGRVAFPKRVVSRQLKMVVTWSFEVHFQTSLPHILAYTIIMDPTPPPSLWPRRPLIWVSPVAAPHPGKGLTGDSLEPQLFPSGLTCWASGYNMFTDSRHFCFFLDSLVCVDVCV